MRGAYAADMEHPGSPAVARHTPPVLPPPPPPPTRAQHHPVPVAGPEPGQLTLGWRIATAIVWGLVFIGYVAVSGKFR